MLNKSLKNTINWFLKRKRLISLAVIVCLCFLIYQLLSLKELNVQMSDKISQLKTGLVNSYHNPIAAHEYSNEVINDIKFNTNNGLNVQLIGVLDKYLTLYQIIDNQFRCLLSGEHIPYQHLNDDYCDCSDGSDEPSTNACPDTKFYCKPNADKSQQMITSSKVNDGICDCDDGSDEWSTKVCPLRHQ